MAIREVFKAHKLNSEGVRKVTEVAEAFSALSLVLDAHCPPGRHAAIVATHLEEAAMMANKAIASAPINRAHEGE